MDDNHIRYIILKRLKEMYDEHPFKYMDNNKFKNEMNLPDNLLLRNVKYLDGKGLLKTTWFHGGFTTRLSSFGIDEIERVETYPNNPTSFLPPLNIILGNVENSQIQQGFHQVMKAEFITPYEKDMISQVLSDIKELINNQQIPEKGVWDKIN